MRFGDGLVRHLSVEDVDPSRERAVTRDRLRQSVLGNRFDVRKRCVRECLCRCDRNGAGHVRDAVVRDAVHLVHGFTVRRRPRRLRAATLVDRDVREDRTVFHPCDHLARDQLRCTRTGDEDRADDDVCVLHGFLDLKTRRHDEAHTTREHLLEVAHAVQRPLEDGDVRAEAESDHRRVVADHSSADDHDASRCDSWDPTEQKPTPAERHLEKVRPGLSGEPSGDLAHRCEQRQRSRVGLDGLVRHGGDPAVDERVRERLVRSDVEVGEEHETVA